MAQQIEGQKETFLSRAVFSKQFFYFLFSGTVFKTKLSSYCLFGWAHHDHLNHFIRVLYAILSYFSDFPFGTLF